MKIQTERFRNYRSIPFVLLFVTFITYGYQLTKMGLYWGDWEVAFLSNYPDPGVFFINFWDNLPFSGWIYHLAIPLLGMKPVVWHITAILLRWFVLLGFWWALRKVWPRYRFEIAWACVLMAVYPAFTLQSNSVTYSRFFVALGFYAFSLGLSFRAIDHPKNKLIFALSGIAASVIQLITLDYFIGLEFLRPLFLFIIIRRQQQDRWIAVKKSLWNWLPYAGILILFAGYRFFGYPGVSPELGKPDDIFSDGFLADGWPGILNLLTLIVQDLIHLLIGNWLIPFDPGNFVLKAKANWLSWGAGLGMTLMIAWLFCRLPLESTNQLKDKDDFTREAIFLGLAGLLFCGLPIWVAGGQSIFSPWSDRFSLALMVGVVLILVGVIRWFARERFRQTILYSLLVCFAISHQMQIVNKYRLSWEDQKDYFWQLVWRVPELKTGTTVIGPEMPFAFVEDRHVGFALNNLYYSGSDLSKVPVWFFSAKNLFETDEKNIKPGSPIPYSDPVIRFTGSTDQAVVVEYAYGKGCLHVINETDNLRLNDKDGQNALWAISKPEFIDLHPHSPAVPRADIFGAEPAHGWCYSYQKIESAIQEKNWEQAARMADEAAGQGLKPGTVIEFTPVILAYSRTGQSEKATRATLSAYQMDPDQSGYLCALWQSEIEKDYASPADLDQMNSTLLCDSIDAGKQ